MTEKSIVIQKEDVNNVYVLPSTLGESVGLGLYAAKQFQKGDIICYYTGIQMNGREAASVKQRAYLMRLCKNLSIDAGPCLEMSARYINDNSDKSKLNVRFQKEPELFRAAVIALKTIEKHEELFVSYGKQYWKELSILKKRSNEI